MPSTRGQHRPRTLNVLAWLATGVLLLAVNPVASSAGDPPAAVPLFRLFLKDGTPLVSYGEYTRIGDRVAFTVPLGSVSQPEGFQIITLPLSALDWDRTTQYADTVRFRHYAATRGDADYTALTADVARATSEIALARDPARRLELAKRARAMLIEWPRTHFGYRSEEVRDLTLVLDEAISAAQAQLGESRFAFDLVATVQPPPGTQLPVPSLAESVDSARAAARASDSPAERLSLQQAILTVLDARRADLPPQWADLMRDDIRGDARRDRRDTRAYASLTSRAVRTGLRHVQSGNVNGVERLLADVRARDAALGHRRADEMASLTATLESHLELARRRRLELDRWLYRTQTFAAYRKTTDDVRRRVDGLSQDIEAVRALSGPAPSRLPRLLTRLNEAAHALARTPPPDELHDGHAALVSAISLMVEAVRQRGEAVRTADARVAANASAAAAGSLLLFARAQAAVQTYFERPDSR